MSASAGTTAATANAPANGAPPLASMRENELQGKLSETVVSQVGEWFYLNEARLRSWSADQTCGARAGSSDSVASRIGGGGGGGGDGATSGEAGAAVTVADLTTVDPSNPTSGGAEKAGGVVAAAGNRLVHFFSTMEREVVPAKKATAKKKSVPSVMLQKEEVTRWTLPAKSSVTLTLEFCSKNVGNFVERCVFGVVGSLQQLCLTVSAAVGLPDISRDAKDIFPVVKPRLGGGGGGAAAAGARRVPKVYISSKKLFDFGALLIAPPPTAKGRRRSGGGNSVSTVGAAGAAAGTAATGEKTSPPPNTAGRVGSAEHAAADAHTPANTPFEETLSFVNREPAEAEVTLSFMNDKEKTFTVTPVAFKLAPGATQRVQLRANPEKPGDFANTLIACIKDNPVPWKVEVICTGARPTLSINGAKESLEVDFGRLVLRRNLVKSFTLANDGAVPLQWRLVPVQEAVGSRSEQRSGGGSAAAASSASLPSASQWPAELHCSTMEGVLEENEVQTLEMTFAPTHPCLHSRTVNFLVSEVGQPQAVYEMIPMTIKAEGYDVVVEWTRELQLGVLHVGEEKKEAIRIMNKSPYDIGYQLRMPKRLQRALTISAPSGTLRGMMGHKDAAIATIDVVARLDTEGELPAKLSMMEVAFFDVEKQELLYPLQTLPVYGEAWYNTYAVHPPSVSFGSCMVGQARESTFELANTGRFPMEFSLFNYREVSSAVGGGGGSAAAQNSETDVAPGARRSLKSLKGVENDFVVGAFTCRPGQGVVPVGGTQVITVSTVPSQQNRTHETVGVRVVQSSPELERYGTPVEISAYPAAPSIASDLTSSADVETIFEEQRVVYRLDQLPKGMRAYSKEERVFSFGTVLVGQRCEERFRIANSSPLTCSVAVQLEGIAGFGGNSGGGGASGTGNGRRSVVGGGNASGGGGGGGAGGEAAKPEAFDLSIDGKGATTASTRTGAIQFTLPPFESRFLTVAFTPTSLCRLQAQLVAMVDSAATPSEERGEVGQQLRFGLCGEGTLPTVELVLPRPYPAPDTGRTRHSLSGTAEHLRGSDGSAGGDRKKNARRRQVGAGSMSITNLPAEGHFVGTGADEMLEMPLTRVGATASRSFTIRNTGCVEAQVYLDLFADNDGTDDAAGASASLSMSAGSSSKSPLLMSDAAAEPCRKLEVAVPAGESQMITITYTPSQVESTTTRLRMVLEGNPFEDKEVQVVARSFTSTVSFEDIDPASSDFLHIGDCYPGVGKTCTFSARNNTDSLLRYVWELPESVLITPSLGHLPAGASRTFAATVCSGAEGLGQRVHCVLHSQSIVLQSSNAVGGATASARTTAVANTTTNANPHNNTAVGAAAVSEWNNSLQSPKWVLREDDADVHANAAAYLSAAAAMMGRRNLKQVMEAVPEPAYTVIDEADITQPLTIGYRCGVPTYSCQLMGGSGCGDAAAGTPAAATPKAAKAISFSHTYLLQKRIAVVRITNTGAVALPYSCRMGTNAFASPLGKEATTNDPSGAAATATNAQTSGPSWAAAQLSAEASSGGLNNSPISGGEVLSPESNSVADFGVTSSSWTLADAAPSDTHVVEAGSCVDLDVEFTPRTVGLLTAELLLHFPHSDPREVQMPLQGVGECPLVHFKVPLSSASKSEARKKGLGQSSFLVPATTTGITTSAAAGAGQEQGAEPVVVEFLARGLHTKATVRFSVLNPTSGSYSYEWIEESANGAATAAAGGGGGAMNGKRSAAVAVPAGGAGAVGGGAMMSAFRCLTTSGVIAAGRSTEATFEFFADALGLRESAWSFRIPGRAAVPFRLVGSVVEPSVYLHASRVDFHHVQVGTRVERSVVLENSDDAPFPFAWDKLLLEGTSTFLSVKPLRGTIAPRERLPVVLSFSPQEEMEYNVTLRCAIKKLSLPLSINVKGVGVCVHDALQVEPGSADDTSAEVVTVLRGQPLTLDLGRVQVNAIATRRFVLRNTGSHPFHYAVDTPAHPCVRYDNADGVVEAGQSAMMVLQYTPVSEETLKQCRLVFRIEGSVAYKVSVRAVAYLPRLRLSFDRYDFGPRFVAAYNNALSTSLAEAAAAPDVAQGASLTQEQPAGTVLQELQLTNVESEAISVACSMATKNTWCKLGCTSLVVRPKETARLQLMFAPTETRHYEDFLELRLNEVHTARLQIEGEGVAPRVEVTNPYAKLGAVRVGESRSVEVRMQCLSRIPTPVSFARAVDEDLKSKGISIVILGRGSDSASSTSTMLMLKPKETVTVSIVFTPTQRMSEFSREVKMLVCGVELPFVSVSGSCVDAEVHLDSAHLDFRDVVIGASASRRVVILNSGDLPQKFSWVESLQQLKPAGEWSITPSAGFVRAHTEVACEVRFTPGTCVKNSNSSSGNSNNKRKAGSTAGPVLSPTASPLSSLLPPQRQTRVLKLELDGAPAVSLSVDANAVMRPAATETVQFACRARESDTQMIEVENTSDQLWTAEPVIDNPLWSCSPSTVTLKPRATTAVAVTYNPSRATSGGTAAASPRTNPSSTERGDKTRQSVLATTTTISPPPQPDKGFFFIPLPDGTGRCVALEGTAEVAGPAGPLQRYDAVARVSLPLRFQVHNWSASGTMRFRAEVEWTAGPRVDSGDGAAQVAIRAHDNDVVSSTPQKGATGNGAGAGDVSAARNTASVNSGRSKAGNKAVTAAGGPAVRGALEVPAKLSKEFVLMVTPLRDGTFRGVVRFLPIDKNGIPISDEGMLQFFEVEVNAKAAPAAAPTVIELRAAIRDVATFSIPLTNPLTKAVGFSCKTSVVDSNSSAAAVASAMEGFTIPSACTVPAQSHGKAVVSFFPLLYKKAPATVQCVVTSSDLGTNDVYLFRLTTTTEVAAPERATAVVCPLGQHVSFVLRFTHYARSNTEFAIRLAGETLGKTPSSISRVGGGGGSQGASIKVGAVHFPTNTAAASYAGGGVPRGQEVTVEFSYEPFEMGEERTTIELVSPVAGTYVFPIVATCTAPQRQGPFTTRAGQNLQLPFKNVFHEPVNINVASDSLAFVPAKKMETVPAHKTMNVVLQCKADEEKDVVRGRVSITCTPPGKNPQRPVEWLYYVEMTGGTDGSGAGKQSGRKK
jgi:hydrocephalus-inducing protein